MKFNGNTESKNGKQYQFSIRSILILNVVIALAVAFPQVAVATPFAMSIIFLTIVSTLLVGTVQIIFAEDRRTVAAYTWQQLRGLLVSMLCLGLYLWYAVARAMWG